MEKLPLQDIWTDNRQTDMVIPINPLNLCIRWNKYHCSGWSRCPGLGYCQAPKRVNQQKKTV